MRIEEPKPIKIQTTDIISGSLYLKLITDYREYDTKQKEYVLFLENRISELIQVLKEIKSNNVKKLFEKLEKRKNTIHEQSETIKKLKVENGELIHKLALLNLKINSSDNE